MIPKMTAKFITQQDLEIRGLNEDSIPNFINYVIEDKSRYVKASTKFIDSDDDFLIGDSDGILQNISFLFINTHLFSEVANFYEEHGCYTHAKEHSEEWVAFWTREKIRRLYGMEAPCKLNKDGSITTLRITGDHYNFLNYSRIRRRLTAAEKIKYESRGDFKTALIEGFPKFYDAHYWLAKIDEFCVRNNINFCDGKARGKGHSYFNAARSANTVNLRPSVVVGYTAIDDKFLTDPGAVMDMVKNDLDWYEENTDWQRGYLSETLSSIELGYKESTGGHKKKGYRSSVIASTCKNNPNALAGKRVIEGNIEESGLCDNIGEVIDMSLSAAEVGNIQVGIIRAFGAPGTKEVDWKNYSAIFYNPKRYKMVEMENVWDTGTRSTVCGFFHPQIWALEGFIDEHGNSDLLNAYLYDVEQKRNQEETSDVSTFYAYCSQRANSPAEAFREGNINIFSSVGLKHWEHELTNNPRFRFYRDGMVIDDGEEVKFKTNTELKTNGIPTHPYITNVPFESRDDKLGCIREYYPPVRIKLGNEMVVPDNLYAIVYDPVGKDKDVKEISTKNSLNSAYVIMLPNTITQHSGDLIVAAYVGRHNTLEEDDRIVLNLAKYYNAKVLVETDRGSTVSNFRRWKALRYLYKDPTNTLDNKIVTDDAARYGINIGSGSKADNALLDLKDMIYTEISKNSDDSIVFFYNNIVDLPLIKELGRFNKKGNFDRVSALRLYPYIRSMIIIKKIQAKASASGLSLAEALSWHGYKR